jgi:hypothetical protein
MAHTICYILQWIIFKTTKRSKNTFTMYHFREAAESAFCRKTCWKETETSPLHIIWSAMSLVRTLHNNEVDVWDILLLRSFPNFHGEYYGTLFSQMYYWSVTLCLYNRVVSYCHLIAYDSLNNTTEWDWLQGWRVPGCRECCIGSLSSYVNKEGLVGLIFCKSLFVHAIY